MSETKKRHSYPHHKKEEVSINDLREFIAEHPELYPGILGEAATKLVTIEPTSSHITDTEEAEEQDKRNRRELLDANGWKRLVLDTPADGIKVMFKGRHDLPAVETIGPDSLLVSLRPLYHDEPTGLMGGVMSEQQTSYAGSHGSDPRLIMQPGGAISVVDRALQEAAGRDLILICDETPQGMRTLFQAVAGLVGESELSELAIRLSRAEYSGLSEPSEEFKNLISEISVELTAALTCDDLTPHQALELVFLAHVGSEESRKNHSTKLNEMIKDRLKKDNFGEDEPEVYLERKTKLVEALNDPERNDYWVHRDHGVLRPSDLILTGGSYVDYPRHTTHGCLNVAIDVEKNVHGSGGHGLDREGRGCTTVASPMGSFVEKNGMPINLEAADTYFVNKQGLVIPEGSLFVTASPDEQPEDISSSEIWIPSIITDEDIENGALEKIFDSVSRSIYMSTLSEDEKSSLLYRLERVIAEVDNSWQVQSLASSEIIQSEIERIMKAKGLTEDEARSEYFSRVQERLSDYTFGKLVIVEGVALPDFPFQERAKQDAIKIALDRILEEQGTPTMTGFEFSTDSGGVLNIPLALAENKLDAKGLESMTLSIRGTYAFKKLSPEKQEHLLQALRVYYNGLPKDDELVAEHPSGYGYNHEWGYEVDRKAREVLSIEVNKIEEESSGVRKRIHELYEKAKESELAKSLGGSDKLNIEAAALAIYEGGTEEEIKARYHELIKQSRVKASGMLRSERLRDWLAYNLIDQDEFRGMYSEILDTNLSKAKAQRRSDYLQVWLINSYVSNTRSKPTPKLESFGRGLDWDVPGATEQIKQDYSLAESIGLQTERHADSMMSTYEGLLYSELKIIKDGIAEKPEKVSYGKLIGILKKIPLGLAARYVRAGMVSFDQDARHDASVDGDGFLG